MIGTESVRAHTKGIKTSEKNGHIAIEGRRWFQKTYGNTYHSVNVYHVHGTGANYSRDLIGSESFAYGYGDQYLQTAFEILQKKGYFSGKTYYDFQRDIREHREKYSIDVSDVSKKSDL